MVERQIGVWDDRRQSWSAGPGTLARLALAELRLALSRAPDADVVLIGYPGHLDVPAARLAARGRPLVFDPLVSLHDTLVHDRGRFRPGSLTARALGAIDRAAFRAAQLVVADTAANAQFYVERLGVAPQRVRVCLVGADDRLFQPRKPPQAEEPFHALFVGKLIPLHGVETILAAAYRAPEIQFRIVGSGQLEHTLATAPENVSCVPWLEYESLPAAFQRAGCALGVFGTSEKATRVIPNKAYQALACGTALVTADTPAARELLTSGENALLVPAGDPEALADTVQRLAGDPGLRRRIGAGGRATYVAQASEEVLGERWRTLLHELEAGR